MPIRIPNELPTREILKSENISILNESEVYAKNIPTLKIIILNLMPIKENTETQLLRLLGNTSFQIDISFIHPNTHLSKNTSLEHLQMFYKTFDQVKYKKFDGMIITGAPVEQIDFEKVNYWEELQQIMDWSVENVTSTLHICWGAFAGLYHHYNVKKYVLKDKLFGVFQHSINVEDEHLLKGFDDEFFVPHSRYAEISYRDVCQIADLRVLSSSQEAGIYIVASRNKKQVFVTGHSEYDVSTLEEEYIRDQKINLDTPIPKRNFPKSNINEEPNLSWKIHANLLFSNWLNHYVYRGDLENIPDSQIT